MLLLTGIGLQDGSKLPAFRPPFVEGTLGRQVITWTAQRKAVNTKDTNGIMTRRSVQAVATAMLTLRRQGAKVQACNCALCAGLAVSFAFLFCVYEEFLIHRIPRSKCGFSISLGVTTESNQMRVVTTHPCRNPTLLHTGGPKPPPFSTRASILRT